MDVKLKERRERAMQRLESQLKTNVKTTKEGIESLTESDKKRIEKEISILKTRIV